MIRERTMIKLFVPILCGVLLAALTGALIFSDKFRKDMLAGGEGKADILGILSVEGVAIIVLVGLFISVLIFSLKETRTKISADTLSAVLKQRTLALTQAQSKYGQIKQKINEYMIQHWIPPYLRDSSGDIFEQLTRKAGKYNKEAVWINKITSEQGKSQDIFNQIDILHEETRSIINRWYDEASVALASNDMETYKDKKENNPSELKELDLLEQKLSSKILARKEVSEFLGEYKELQSKQKK